MNYKIIGCNINTENDASISVGDIHVHNFISQNTPREPHEKKYFNFVPPVEDLFVGRDEDIENLTDLFFKQNKRKVALYGLPGYGKTETAKRFVTERKVDKINHVLWMDASSPDDLKTSLKHIAQQLNVDIYDGDSLISRVFGCFKSVAQKTMIVYDNAANQQTILKYEEHAKEFYRLITTKNSYWTDGTQPQELKELSPEFALEILHKKIHDLKSYFDENVSLFEKLTDILGRVPLALQIIGSIIEYNIRVTKGNFRLKNYIKKLENKEEEYLEKSAEDVEYSSIPYKNSLYQAMKISINEIAIENGLALNVLYVCSFLNPEQIYFNTLMKMENISELLRKCDDAEEEFQNALIKLRVISFIQANFKDEKINIHRFVQNIIRYHIKKSDVVLQNKIYVSCLRLTLSNEHYYHIPSIIMHADRYTSIFLNFYKAHFETYKTNAEYAKLKYWEAKCSGLQLILEILIEEQCKQTLEEILVHLIPKTRDYINEFNLLHVSAMIVDEELFDLLLAYGPNVDKDDIDGHCALHVATCKWNESIINLLIKYKANLTLEDNNGYSLLYTFIRGGCHVDSVDTEQVKRIIKRLQPTEQIKDIRNPKSKESLLHEAASTAQPELVKLLITDYGLDVNVQEKLGYTPLHSLILKAFEREVDEQRVIDTAEIFLRNKASVHIPNAHGTTPLKYAKRFKVDYLKHLFYDFIDEEDST